MAQWYGVNATYPENTTPAAFVPPGDGGGTLRTWFDSWTLPSPAASGGDVINLFPVLPPQNRIIDFWMGFVAWANSATLSVGWLANETDAANSVGLASAVSVTSAGQYRTSTTLTAWAPKKFNVGAVLPLKTTQIQALIGTAPTNTSGINTFVLTTCVN